MLADAPVKLDRALTHTVVPFAKATPETPVPHFLFASGHAGAKSPSPTGALLAPRRVSRVRFQKHG
jgi:hypothetical protein